MHWGLRSTPEHNVRGGGAVKICGRVSDMSTAGQRPEPASLTWATDSASMRTGRYALQIDKRVDVAAAVQRRETPKAMDLGDLCPVLPYNRGRQRACRSPRSRSRGTGRRQPCGFGGVGHVDCASSGAIPTLRRATASARAKPLLHSHPAEILGASST